MEQPSREGSASFFDPSRSAHLCLLKEVCRVVVTPARALSSMTLYFPISPISSIAQIV